MLVLVKAYGYWFDGVFVGGKVVVELDDCVIVGYQVEVLFSRTIKK